MRARLLTDEDDDYYFKNSYTSYLREEAKPNVNAIDGSTDFFYPLSCVSWYSFIFLFLQLRELMQLRSVAVWMFC